MEAELFGAVERKEPAPCPVWLWRQPVRSSGDAPRVVAAVELGEPGVELDQRRHLRLLYAIAAWVGLVAANAEDPVARGVTTVSVGGPGVVTVATVVVAMAALSGVLGLLVVLLPTLISSAGFPATALLAGVLAHLAADATGSGVGLVTARPGGGAGRVLVRPGRAGERGDRGSAVVAAGRIRGPNPHRRTGEDARPTATRPHDRDARLGRDRRRELVDLRG